MGVAVLSPNLQGRQDFCIAIANALGAPPAESSIHEAPEHMWDEVTLIWEAVGAQVLDQTASSSVTF